MCVSWLECGRASSMRTALQSPSQMVSFSVPYSLYPPPPPPVLPLHPVLPSDLPNACLSPFLWCMAGNVRVLARVRPGFEHEDSTAVAFPDEFSLRLSVPSTSASAASSTATSPVKSSAGAAAGGAAASGAYARASAADRAAGGSATSAAAGATKREVELDAVLGPHVGQGECALVCVVHCKL